MRNLSPSVPHAGNVLCRISIFSFFLSTITLTITPLFAEQDYTDKHLKEKATFGVQKLQMPFIANNGQVDERVLFYAQIFGGTVFVNKDGDIVYSLQEGRHESEGTKDREERQAQDHLMQDARGIVLKEQLVGGKIDEIKGGAKSVATVSYFTGNDPSKWRSNIPTYGIVDMGEVYEGVDLRLKAYGNNVEKIFTVKPDANHETIRIRLEGAQELMVNTAGELIAETEFGTVKFTKPLAYQEIEGKRVEVECKYTIADRGMRNTKRKTNPKSKIRNPKLEYGFKVAGYNRTKDLIIDPLLASTYLGGPYEDRGRSIAVDADGNVFVAGETLSSEFPSTPGAYRTSRKGNTDVFVSKFNSELTSLLASTFLGGALNHERACSISIDSGGNVYVAGSTYSTDFPTTRGAYDAAGNGRWDVFVSKFNNGLTNLMASTFLGGNSDEYGYSIAIDTDGNVYVAGETLSSDFPATPGAYDTSYNGGYYDAFVSKFNSGLTSLLASTFLGGGSGDYCRAVAVDGAGNIFVTGNTWSKDFPVTPDAYNTSYNGGNDDVFVSKLSNRLTNLLASTFLGGYSNDYGKAIAIDTGGNVYVAGETVSPNFPTTDSAYATVFKRGSKDIFVSKFNNQLASLSASTLLGGNAHDYGRAIIIDAGGNVYVAGSTSSTDFPTTSGAYDTTPNGDSDVFVSKFNSELTNLLMSTFQGGSRSDYCNAIAVSAVGYVYVTGETLSSDFPTTLGTYDTFYHRCEDVFVSKFSVGLSVDKANK
ncbi:MAG: SBBP repeat-containing protein [Candidatus Brocadia sp.]|jgi:hypothetical protein